jgi:hypothetical protein
MVNMVNMVRNLAACFTLDQAAGILEFSPEQSQQLLKNKMKKNANITCQVV